MSDQVVHLKGVSKTYDSGISEPLTVLEGVDLELARGEVVALVAPSGAGKSTLLHIAGLLDEPSDGEVWICGEQARGLPEKRRTEIRRDRIGFVYQFHHLLPEFSALENVAMPQRAAGVALSVASERAAELLDMVGLAARADHRPAELSGGEQQRVAICRALANVPALILADEPTGNLDPETAETVFDVLISIARQTGLTGLVATHNLELAQRMDRIVRLDAGQLTDR
jgi:lipoprotein-releasing system ATP-binding protein